MRTPEQIKNLRRALLTTTIGHFAILLSDEQVDKMADKIQEDINRREENRKTYVPYFWKVKIRLKENVGKPWEEIDFEPKIVYCTHNVIMKKCHSLLIKFPAICSIQITDQTNYSYEFNRE